MTSRFILSEPPGDLALQLGIGRHDNFPPRYNIAPSQPVAIIRSMKARRFYSLVRWGFVPGWDTAGTFFEKPLVNIKAESAPIKNSFRHAFRRRRCLFPMNGFYAWVNEGGKRKPYFLCKDQSQPLFCVAGLWEDWQGANGAEMETAAIITQPSVYPLSQLQTRTPVVVSPDRYDDWLACDEFDDKPAHQIIAAHPPGFEWWQVSNAVNNWRHDGAALITPLSGDDAEAR